MTKLTGEQLHEICLRHNKPVAGYRFSDKFDFDAIANEISGLAVSTSPALPDKCDCGHKWHGDDACQWKGREEDAELHCTCPESQRTLVSKDFQSVSASPQPRCPKCGVGKSLVLRDYEDGWRLVCGANCGLIIGPNAATGLEFDLTDFLPFFPASLKGDKPLRNKAMDYLRTAIEECRTGKTITFQADHLITLLGALGDESTAAAQEQPVENSPQLDDSRCAVCGWPLAESVEKGCVRGNCSMRPFPEVFYDLERAEREYGKRFGVQAGVPQAEPPKKEKP